MERAHWKRTQQTRVGGAWSAEGVESKKKKKGNEYKDTAAPISH